jgi:hypothetical protein
VAVKDSVDQRSELDGATAHVEAFHLEGDHAIIAGETEFAEFYLSRRHECTPGARGATRWA